jgi:N-methylhydantoinase B
VLFDVEAGLVTEAGARRYGVVIQSDRVDSAATADLRARMAKERGKAPLFDRGFANIDELKARCLSETGLPPPATPRFSALTRARAKPAPGKQRSHA